MTIDEALDLLTNSIPDLRALWLDYLSEEYQNYATERLDFIDIGIIAKYIVDSIARQNINGFDDFFDTLESIFNNASKELENLMIVGLIEDIQNICGHRKIDYYKNFDEWLKPVTKTNWDAVIHFWEGK